MSEYWTFQDLGEGRLKCTRNAQEAFNGLPITMRLENKMWIFGGINSSLSSIALQFEHLHPEALHCLKNVIEHTTNLERLSFQSGEPKDIFEKYDVGFVLQHLPRTRIRRLLLTIPGLYVREALIFCALESLTTTMCFEWENVNAACTKLLHLDYRSNMGNHFPTKPEHFIRQLQTFNFVTFDDAYMEVMAFLKYVLRNECFFKWQRCRIRALEIHDERAATSTNPVMREVWEDYLAVRRRFDHFLACNRHIHRTIVSRTLLQFANRVWPVFGNSIVDLQPTIFRHLNLQ